MLGMSEQLDFKPYKCEVLCTSHEIWWIRPWNKTPIKSAITAWKRSKPRNVRSLQSKRHQCLFFHKKLPKTEDENNENTHYQRAHVKGIQHSFFGSPRAHSRPFCFMRSKTTHFMRWTTKHTYALARLNVSQRLGTRENCLCFRSH